MDPATDPDDRLAHVLRTMQLDVLPSSLADVLVKSAGPIPAGEVILPFH